MSEQTTTPRKSDWAREYDEEAKREFTPRMLQEWAKETAAEIREDCESEAEEMRDRVHETVDSNRNTFTYHLARKVVNDLPSEYEEQAWDSLVDMGQTFEDLQGLGQLHCLLSYWIHYHELYQAVENLIDEMEEEEVAELAAYLREKYV